MRESNLMCVLACLAATLATSAWAGQAPSAQQPLDDPLEVLAPKQGRSEEDVDHLAALAHFSAGHLLEERHQFAEALREYERALRDDSSALPVLRELVPLADSLNRREEALRYLVKYVQKNPVDPVLLERSAEYLTGAGDYPGALRLYQHLARLLAGEKPSPRQIAVQRELGRLYVLSGQYADAAAAFKQVMEALDKPKQFGLDPLAHKALLGEGGATYDLIGTVFLEAKQTDNARMAFERLEKIHPDAATRSFNFARVGLAASKPNEALTELENYFATGDAAAAKKGTAPYELLAKILKQLEQRDQLISRLEVLCEQQPKNVALAYFLGQQQREAGKLEKAQALLEAAAAEKPSEEVYRALAELYHRGNQSEKLLDLLAQVLEKTGSLSALDSEGKALAADEKMTTALIELAQKQHGAAGQNDHFSLRAAGLIAAEAKRWNDVETLFNLAMKARPDSAGELLLVWGLALFLDEKSAEAAAVFQRGIDEHRLPDDNPTFYAYLAGALDLQDKTDDALVAAKIAAEKQPKTASTCSRTARILYRTKRFDEAVKAYQELIDKFQDDFSNEETRETLREARLALSNICVLRHDAAPAAEWLEQVLDEFPDDAGANNDLGYLWADENLHLHRAHEMIQFAVAAEPENYAYRDSLGWVLHRLGREGEALAQLQKAAAGENPDGEVLDHMGQVYLKLGQPAEAKSAWTRSAAAFKKAGEQEKMKAVQQKLEAQNLKL